MMQTLMLQIVNKIDILSIIIVSIAYFLNWAVLLNLGYFLLHNKMNTREIFIYALAGLIYSFIGRTAMTNSLYFIFHLALFFVLLSLLSKKPILSVSFAVVAVYMSFSLSVMIFGSALTMINKDLEAFLLNTFPGMVIGTFIETIVPILIMIICIRFKIQLIPRFTLGTRLYIVSFIMFASLVFLFYRSVQRTWLEGGTDRFYELAAAVASIICFFGHQQMSKKEKNAIKAELLNQEAEHQKKTEKMAALCKLNINTSAGRFCLQTTDTLRSCLLNICETLKNNETNIPRVCDKLTDIASADVGYNQIFKYILMTKRLNGFFSNTRIVVRENCDLRSYFDMDFWMLFSKLLDIIIKAHKELDYAEARTTPDVLKFSVVYIIFSEYPESITLAIETGRPAEINYTGWKYLKHHMDEIDKETYKRLLSSDEKLFSYGVYKEKVVKIQLSYEKWKMAEAN